MAIVVTLVESWSTSLGMDEKGLMLIISLFLCYPLAFIYRSLFFRSRPFVHHIFFTTTGLLIYYMNFGNAVIHHIVNILVIYLLLVFAAGTLISVFAAFIFNSAYLIVAYWYIKNDVVDKYEITWTIPHCVLTLRLTAVVFDMYDSHQPRDSLSEEKLSCVMTRRPSLLQMFGHSSFLCTFLIGPQFSMRRYQNQTERKYCDHTTGGPPVNLVAGLSRFGVGLCCALTYQIFTPFFPLSYFSGGFLTAPFWWKCVFITIWAKVTLYRYIGVWIIAEGCIILTGLTHNGQDNNGNDLWDGCANVKLRNYESSTNLRGIIDSFNINTNRWMSQYLFKRLRFLGVKWLSHTATLLYLALWHGLYSGYYHTFAMEFITYTAETGLGQLLASMPLIRSLQSSPVTSLPLLCVQKCFQLLTIGYCLLGFCLLKFAIYYPVYKSMYFFGHILALLVLVIINVVPVEQQTRTSPVRQTANRRR